ncbi:mitochondrial amidoxime-reducing component 1-like [Mytilus galloprovincialis]|uniref:mitochondrial amidoxime-reducing component 1-like n=1 Tax=Mytilus galloprovincialis TaxID=29158 RepID=UPI003F7BE89C
MDNILLALAGTSFFKYAAYMYMSKRSYQCVGTVSELYLYPVKSCKGLKVNSLRCTRLGVEYDGMYDRHWVFATEKDGQWITQRQEPRMALISISLHGDEIHFDAPGMTTLKLPKDPKKDQCKVKKVQVKMDIIDSLDCGTEAAAWISKFLGRKMCLHYSPSDMEKRDAVNAQKLWSHDAKKGDLFAFSDYCAYMMLSQSGLDELNNRLAEPVTCLNFRSNIIVKGCPPYDEDHWDVIKIRNAKFRNIDACTRCILTTVDPFKGEKSKDEEPLKTLQTYRAFEPYPPSKPLFGIHLANDVEDVIHVGDPIYAIRK